MLGAFFHLNASLLLYRSPLRYLSSSAEILRRPSCQSLQPAGSTVASNSQKKNGVFPACTRLHLVLLGLPRLLHNAGGCATLYMCPTHAAPSARGACHGCRLCCRAVARKCHSRHREQPVQLSEGPDKCLLLHYLCWRETHAPNASCSGVCYSCLGHREGAYNPCPK